MFRSKRRGPARQARLARDEAVRARDEAITAWDHMRSAATDGVRRFGSGSRRRKEAAQERANNAALALRGKTPGSTIRKWLGTGLAAGAVIGAAGAAVLRRRRDSHETDPDTGVRDRANAAVDTVKERATTAAHKAATSARDTAAKLSEATKPREDNGHQSGAQHNRQTRMESNRAK